MSDGELIVARRELDELHDRLYVLACAVDDTERDLAAVGNRATADDLSELLTWLLEAARPLREAQISAPTGPP